MSKLILQLGHPKIIQNTFPTFQQVRDIFKFLFRPIEESSYLFWHEIPIQLNYREDLYHNFDAILAMVWLVYQEDSGATRIDLKTNLLTMELEIWWEGNELHIYSAFTENDEFDGAYADALNALPEIWMKRDAFLREWKMLLQQIMVAEQAGNIKIVDGTERRKWELLQHVVNHIPGYGELYVRKNVEEGMS